ncbi:acetyltransferase [Vibrio sp. S/42/10]|uniref:GNAT family N-acetyltransferase n=1 Tax=Vibrio sp. S/42/10 TaxID=2914757 RepID=UPI00246921DB|nr:GNAT family N-acetyltransferase [Vibrio sp. S/42/10]MDH5880607.1 acetyltransferase [Vibrio sp. S/42/10]
MTGSHQPANTLPDGQSVSLTEGLDRYSVEVSSGSLEVVRETDHFWRLTEMTATEQEALSAFALLFSANSDIRTIELGQFKSEVLDSLSFETAEGLKVLWREAVMQTPELWLKNRNHALYPHKQVLDAAGYHPARPKPLYGELYRRYIPELNAVLILEGLDVDKHLTLFNKWQNTKRVANFWEQTGSLEEHKFYLEESCKNHKNQLLIVCLDNQPFAYIEVYWTKEDRIAPYYAAGDYDRGIHMLVGEESHRGAHKVAAWLPSVCHFIYLSDPRTEKIVSEPRADNNKMIGYLQKYGFAKVKEFEFPHKRAALMCQLKDSFFSNEF